MISKETKLKALTAVRDISEDLILNELEETIRLYRETKDKSLGPNLRQLVAILVIKMILVEKGNNVDEVLEEMDLTFAAKKFFKPNQN